MFVFSFLKKVHKESKHYSYLNNVLILQTKLLYISNRLGTLIKGIVCINMIHISPWSCTRSLFEEARKYLDQSNFLMLYGPFLRKEKQTTVSNLNFDQSLKIQNPLWGIRNLENVNDVAFKNGFKLDNVFDMPANNLSVIYRLK